MKTDEKQQARPRELLLQKALRAANYSDALDMLPFPATKKELDALATHFPMPPSPGARRDK